MAVVDDDDDDDDDGKYVTIAFGRGGYSTIGFRRDVCACSALLLFSLSPMLALC
jgi:hypothetical protein